MNIDAVLAAGRRAAEQRMRDRIRLYEQGPDTFDRETGATVPGPRTTLYEGKARVEPIAQASGEDTQAGEREVRMLEYRVSVPWATVLPPGKRALPGMRIEVLTSPDPRMAGLTLWVTGANYGDQATAWRLTTEDRS
ncbi:DUF6093 family protein [Streptomyces sp. NPDC057540]|uniref:DUF6093 family protein n=1 Tax=Streptomyces sp. NPDC057540 TaxID=3346160 RepID=UPI003679A9C3